MLRTTADTPTSAHMGCLRDRRAYPKGSDE